MLTCCLYSGPSTARAARASRGIDSCRVMLHQLVSLKYYYNNYEYCTLQQQLSKKNVRQAKNKIMMIIIMIIIIVIQCFESPALESDAGEKTRGIFCRPNIHNVYIYIYIYIYARTYIYIYIYVERERDRERSKRS